MFKRYLDNTHCRIIYIQTTGLYKTRCSISRGSDSHKIRMYSSSEIQDVGKPSTATKIKETVAITVILLLIIVGLSLLGGGYA